MKQFKITVNGQAYDVQVEETGGAVPAAPFAAPAAPAVPATSPAAPAATPVAAAPAPAPTPAAVPVGGDVETINAPMPGAIVNILVSAGDSVTKGQVLLILEAMKMENEIMAPADAVVAAVHVNKGESVDSGKPLVSLQ